MNPVNLTKPAQAYRALLSEHGLVGSMARRGNPYDNAMMESFMKTLKVEGVYPMAFESEKDVARQSYCQKLVTQVSGGAFG